MELQSHHSSDHWTQMNCPLNPSLMQTPNSFYISEKEPPDFTLPDDIICLVFHPQHMDGTTGLNPDASMKADIIEFIRAHDRTSSGNVSELCLDSLNRLLSTPSMMAILINDSAIIGTIITLILRVQYRDPTTKEIRDLITSYTTFLCINAECREQGLAMALIRAVMKEGYARYGAQHGYYMTSTAHHSVNSEIKSWYRPIDIKKARVAGFTLQTFGPQGKSTRDSEKAMRQRLAYYIPKPQILPQRAAPDDFSFVHLINKLGHGDLYLNPTQQEFRWLCECFDIYIVNGKGLFMLFPMVSLISATGQRVRTAQLALMIGDVMPQALWAASESKYDLLYGWYTSDVTQERVTNIRGLTTISSTHLELYNTRTMIPPNAMMVPIF